MSQVDIGNALTEMTAGMSGGVPQADGELKTEPTMDATYATTNNRPPYTVLNRPRPRPAPEPEP